MTISRRTLFLGTAAAVASAQTPKPKVNIFSKHLQFLSGTELPQAVAEMGFDGIDITVRGGGHIEPSRVKQDLPPLVALIRKSGLNVPMVTTDIIDAQSPNARDVLHTLAILGIQHYRWGGFKYTSDEPIERQLAGFRQRSVGLAKLNAEYNTCAMYHTHSGVDMVGAPVWDIYEVLKGLDANRVSINYDIGHATVEGGLGGWIDSFRVVQPYIRGVAVKDFLWQRDNSGNWDAAWVPLGTGMVHFQKFFPMLKQSGFNGPLQLHFEYPLGGADAGKRDISISREEVYAAMKRDLKRLREYL
jgi:sugar phosphate isomerase/epimerase